jgi:hypothetical protein
VKGKRNAVNHVVLKPSQQLVMARVKEVELWVWVVTFFLVESVGRYGRAM